MIWTIDTSAQTPSSSTKPASRLMIAVGVVSTPEPIALYGATSSGTPEVGVAAR